jgi:hypothetical protein
MFSKENTSDELSPFRYFTQKIEGKSKKYGEISDIDLNFLKELWHKQNGKCAYTGIDMKLPRNCHETVNSPMRASLDRIDSSRGYFKDNVEFVCQFINLGKNTFSKKEIKKFLYRIKLNWREKEVDKNKK